MVKCESPDYSIIVQCLSISVSSYYFSISDISTSQHHAAKSAVFHCFWQYFSLTWYVMLQSVYIWLDPRKQHKKGIWKRIESKKIRKHGNGNVLTNLIKTVTNIFEEVKKYIFFSRADLEILYWVICLQKKEPKT